MCHQPQKRDASTPATERDHAVGLLTVRQLCEVHESLTVYERGRLAASKSTRGSRPQRAPAIAVGVTDHVWTLTEIAGP